MIRMNQKILIGLLLLGLVASPRASAAEDATDDLDQQLLDELDAGEDIPAGADDPSATDDVLGPDADPVTRIGQKMRTVESLLEEKEQAVKAGELQNEIVRDLEALIKQLRQQQKKASSGGKSQRKPQKSSRDRVQQPAAAKPGKPGTRESKNPANDSEARMGHAKKGSKVDAAALDEVIKAIWGHLPEKDRERLRQISSEEIMPNHEVAIERYFRRLADEDAASR